MSDANEMIKTMGKVVEELRIRPPVAGDNGVFLSRPQFLAVFDEVTGTRHALSTAQEQIAMLREAVERACNIVSRHGANRHAWGCDCDSCEATEILARALAATEPKGVGGE